MDSTKTGWLLSSCRYGHKSDVLRILFGNV